MKKTIIAFTVALSLSGAVHAGDYSDAVSKQKTCDKYGKFAVASYKEFKKGDDRMAQFSKFLKMAADESKAALEAIEAGDSAKSDHLSIISSIYSYNTQADNSKDAYMNAWGKCMDGGT